MRLTVEISPEHHNALASLASQRGASDVSGLVLEAIEEYLRVAGERTRRREQLLAMAGALSREEADDLRQTAAALRETWR